MTYDEIIDNEILKIVSGDIKKLVTDPLEAEAKARVDKWTNPLFHDYYHYFRDRGDTHDVAETKAEDMCK